MGEWLVEIVIGQTRVPDDSVVDEDFHPKISNSAISQDEV